MYLSHVPIYLYTYSPQHSHTPNRCAKLRAALEREEARLLQEDAEFRKNLTTFSRFVRLENGDNYATLHGQDKTRMLTRYFAAVVLQVGLCACNLVCVRVFVCVFVCMLKACILCSWSIAGCYGGHVISCVCVFVCVFVCMLKECILCGCCIPSCYCMCVIL